MLKRFGCVCRLKHFTPADIPVIFVAEEKESTTKSTNNPLAAVLGTVNTTRQIPPTLTFNADNEMVRTLLQIQGDNKMFQHVVHILYVQSLLQGKYPVNSEEMELFNHSLSELMTAKMNDFNKFPELRKRMKYTLEIQNCCCRHRIKTCIPVRKLIC